MEYALIGLIAGASFAGSLVAYGVSSLFSSGTKEDTIEKGENINKVDTKINSKINSENTHGINVFELILILLCVTVIAGLIAYVLAKWCYRIHTSRPHIPSQNQNSQTIPNANTNTLTLRIQDDLSDSLL